MWRSIKNFKVSYSYPLEHPIKVVIKKLGRRGAVGWLFQRYGSRVKPQDVTVTERIIEIPILHQWFGRIFGDFSGEVLEIGHVASSVSLELANIGYRVTAIDLRPYPFSHSRLKSLVGNFLTHTFDCQFDCIFTLSAIEHLGFSGRYGGQDDFDSNLDEQALAKISSLLKPNGVAIISVPYAKNYRNDIWFRAYTRESIESKLNRFFTIIERKYYHRQDNQWFEATPANDPISPHDGVALFLLEKSN